MGMGATKPAIATVHRNPGDLYENLKVHCGYVSKERCLQLLRAIRWMIIQHIDVETYITNVKVQSGYRKTLEWKFYKEAERTAVEELHKGMKSIDAKVIDECLRCYRRIYCHMKISPFPQNLTPESTETSFFSNISIIGEKGMDLPRYRERVPDIDGVVQAFERRLSDRKEKDVESLIRTKTKDMLDVLGKSIKTKERFKVCIYQEELERYEQELKRITMATMNRDNCRVILTQYRKQLQICLFYASKDETKADLDEKINVIPLPDKDDALVLDINDIKEMAEADLRNQLDCLFKDMKHDPSGEYNVDEIGILINIYKEEVKSLYAATDVNDIPTMTKTYLEEKWKTQLMREKAQTKPRDVKVYMETMEKALNAETKSADDDEFQREEIIIYDMEQKRWKELMTYKEKDKSAAENLDELGSDFDTTFLEETGKIKSITQAQAAIVEVASAHKNSTENKERVTTAQAIKAEVEKCKKIDTEFKTLVDSQIKSAKEKLDRDGQKHNETISEESSDEYLSGINNIRNSVNEKYNAIVEIGEKLDDYEDDANHSDDNDGRKQQREKDIGDIKENVKQIQSLMHDMRRKKYDILHKIHKDISALKAHVYHMTQELNTMNEEMRKLKSDITKRNDRLGKKELSEKFVALVETFDRERYAKLAPGLSKEDKEAIRLIMSTEGGRVIEVLNDQVIKPFRKLMETQTPRRQGNASLLLERGQTIHDFFTSRLK